MMTTLLDEIGNEAKRKIDKFDDFVDMRVLKGFTGVACHV